MRHDMPEMTVYDELLLLCGGKNYIDKNLSMRRHGNVLTLHNPQGNEETFTLTGTQARGRGGVFDLSKPSLRHALLDTVEEGTVHPPTYATTDWGLGTMLFQPDITLLFTGHHRFHDNSITTYHLDTPQGRVWMMTTVEPPVTPTSKDTHNLYIGGIHAGQISGGLNPEERKTLDRLQLEQDLQLNPCEKPLTDFIRRSFLTTVATNAQMIWMIQTMLASGADMNFSFVPPNASEREEYRTYDHNA